MGKKRTTNKRTIKHKSGGAQFRNQVPETLKNVSVQAGKTLKQAVGKLGKVPGKMKKTSKKYMFSPETNGHELYETLTLKCDENSAVSELEKLKKFIENSGDKDDDSRSTLNPIHGNISVNQSETSFDILKSLINEYKLRNKEFIHVFTCEQNKAKYFPSKNSPKFTTVLLNVSKIQKNIKNKDNSPPPYNKNVINENEDKVLNNLLKHLREMIMNS